jgi:hypothetical protein
VEKCHPITYIPLQDYCIDRLSLWLEPFLVAMLWRRGSIHHVTYRCSLHTEGTALYYFSFESNVLETPPLVLPSAYSLCNLLQHPLAGRPSSYLKTKVSQNGPAKSEPCSAKLMRMRRQRRRDSRRRLLLRDSLAREEVVVSDTAAKRAP